MLLHEGEVLWLGFHRDAERRQPAPLGGELQGTDQPPPKAGAVLHEHESIARRSDALNDGDPVEIFVIESGQRGHRAVWVRQPVPGIWSTARGAQAVAA